MKLNGVRVPESPEDETRLEPVGSNSVQNRKHAKSLGHPPFPPVLHFGDRHLVRNINIVSRYHDMSWTAQLNGMMDIRKKRSPPNREKQDDNADQEQLSWSFHLPPLPSPPPPHPVVLVNIVWVIMVVHPPPTFISLVAADLASTAAIPNLVDIPAPSTTTPTAATVVVLTIVMLVVMWARETVSPENTTPQ
ncbi:hypothetical protein FJTKL_14086 [Diaporthe vaccinii]|uniref:Uncharacterized protein n=1 Tax=Diaporthe vaccinii TaxID=105482 RepID=A0ABR4E948_9PEZI